MVSRSHRKSLPVDKSDDVFEKIMGYTLGKDVGLAHKRLLGGYWKTELLDDISMLLNTKTLNADFKRNVLERLRGIAETDNSSIFIELSQVFSLLEEKSIFDNEAEVEGRWYKELKRAIQGIIDAHYVELDMNYGTGDVILNKENVFEISKARGTKAREEMEKYDQDWNNFNKLTCSEKNEIYFFYERIQELFDMALIVYGINLSHETKT